MEMGRRRKGRKEKEREEGKEIMRYAICNSEGCWKRGREVNDIYR
jgi:hypothetical protein